MNQTMHRPTPRHQFQHNDRPSMFKQSQKRNRMEFEGEHGDLHQFQTPIKRHKVSHSTHSNHTFSNNVSDSHHGDNDGDFVDFGDENQNDKGRAFQNHAKIAQENFKKQRFSNTIHSRKMNRKFRLQQKHSNAMKNKFKNPDYWSFDCSSQPNTNNDDHKNYQREPSVDTMYDSDEVMSETANNHQSQPPNHHNYASFTEHTYHRNRASFIPQTCPHPTKHRSHSSYMQQSNVPQSASYHNNLNDHRPSPPSSPPPPPSSPGLSPEIKENMEDIIDIHSNHENENDLNMEQCVVEEEEVMEEKKSNDIDVEEIKMQKKKEQEKLIKERSEKRIEELKNEQMKQKNEDKMRHDLRERIHPEIVKRAHPVKHNPVALMRLFYPKTRLNQNASSKDILKAFKRALANFHPDRTINKSMDEQIRAEEIFKLLSTAKENFEKNKSLRNNYNMPSYHKPNNNYRHRRRGHGWF